MAANPRLIGDGAPAPRRTQPAGPVTLAVPTGTQVDAVTAGTLTMVPAGAGMSTVLLTGTDGATYTYRDVRASVARRTKVAAGARIGASGPRGVTFSVSVPDVRGAVDAAQALQAWATGLSVNVRALPSTIEPATPPKRAEALLVTDAGAGATATDLAKSLSGPLVAIRTETVSDARSPRDLAATARQVAEWRAAAADHGRLLLVVLANGTPAQAAAVAARLTVGQNVLWVAPPDTTQKQAAAYRAIVAERPGFRVESLPAALAAVNGASVNAPGALAAAMLVTAYASTAYRLQAESTQARTVVSWAEQQLGKPYQYAAAGPDSFDCSGLTMDALAQAGIAVIHNANAQWLRTKAHSVAENQLAPGDLVFFAGSDGTLTAPGHVGIYVGNGEIIDAPFTGARVRFDPLTSIGGYVGGTDPYALAPTVGATVPAGGISTPVFEGGTSTPATAGLNLYQSFAQTFAAATWGPGQFPYLDLLWERESGWNLAATNPISGAFGIPQALPAVKMASAGLDWATDPYTQIIWGIDYIRATYGTPQAAWTHELAAGWY